nr:hypothetical protein [uncultured Sphingomonas sp.]
MPHRLFDDSFLRFLPSILREPRRAWFAIPVGFLLTFVGSILLAYATQSIAPQLETPEFPMKGGLALFMLVVFAPVVETMIMAAFISLFLRFMKPQYAVVLSAFGWGCVHSAQALGWGLVIWWPFLIFSTLYVVWKQRGVLTGIAVTAATHSAQNLFPALTVAYPHLFKGLGLS